MSRFSTFSSAAPRPAPARRASDPDCARGSAPDLDLELELDSAGVAHAVAHDADQLEEVASGRAAAPTSVGPVPVPPKLGDPNVDAASELAAMRDEERW